MEEHPPMEIESATSASLYHQIYLFFMAESERPQIFLPGDWIPYLRALAACRSRELLDWRAAHWNPGAPRGIMAS
jgi:hypothetical protein